jgi:hypothetical protein
LEDRGIEISNFDPETTTKDTVLAEAAKYGDVDSVDVSEIASGKITVKFFDLRSAHALRSSTVRVGGLTWQLQFAHPAKISNPRKPPNIGTIVMFHVPATLSDGAIREEMERFGEIRELRGHADQRFVEFWDTRRCQEALAAIRAGKVFAGKIAAEYSRPGGFRKNPDAFLANRKPVIARVSKSKAQAINEKIARTEQSENAAPVRRIEKTAKKARVEFQRFAGSVVAA